MYKNEVFARLVITSKTMSPAQITETLKLPPDKSYIINTPKQKETTSLHKYNLWEILIKKNNLYHTEPLVEQLLSLIKPIKNNLSELKNVKKEISVVVYKEKNMPSINYNRKIISFINDINASLDIDVYEIVF